MTVEDNDQLEWRDTYFILFQQSGRPTLTQVEAAITDASPRLKLENLEADEDGLFESVLVQAPQDNAALEISYETGDAVIQQSADLAKQLKRELERQTAGPDVAGGRTARRDAVRESPRQRVGRPGGRRRLGIGRVGPVEFVRSGRSAGEIDRRAAD